MTAMPDAKPPAATSPVSISGSVSPDMAEVLVKLRGTLEGFEKQEYVYGIRLINEVLLGDSRSLPLLQQWLDEKIRQLQAKAEATVARPPCESKPWSSGSY